MQKICLPRLTRLRRISLHDVSSARTYIGETAKNGIVDRLGGRCGEAEVTVLVPINTTADRGKQMKVLMRSAQIQNMGHSSA